jgi:hypothetical protein
MKLRNLLAVLIVAAAGTSWSAASALGDSPASDATQVCLQGPQIDYYQLVGDTDYGPSLDFGNLVHGSDETGPFVVAMNQGDCVSFVARNSKGKNSNGNVQTYYVAVFQAVFVSTS